MSAKTAESQQNAPIPETMKAARMHARGGPEKLVYEDAPVPRLRTGDALVRVYATGITPAELSWDETYRNPDSSDRLPSVPGHEVCGVVAALAPQATEVNPGEAVYGLCDFPRDGAAAEYVSVRAANLAPKPGSLSPTETAAVPLSALTAWQALFHHGGLTEGARVLIHGGAGGVGSFAVQLARWRGAHVIATQPLPTMRHSCANWERRKSSIIRWNGSMKNCTTWIWCWIRLAVKRRNAHGNSCAAVVC